MSPDPELAGGHMTVLRAAVLVAAFASTALSCGAPTGPSDALVAAVVAAERNAAGIVHLDVDWRNEGAIPLYVSACGGHVSMSLERRAAGLWEGVWGGFSPPHPGQKAPPPDPRPSLRATGGVG